MATDDTYGNAGKIALLCIAWYTSSSANSVVGKIILSDFPYPMTVSMVQLTSISLFTTPILYLRGIPSADRIPLKYWFKMILPLAFGKFFSSVSSHISLWKVPVSYAHTVKATMPLFTVILTRIFLKETQTSKVYISLLPIVGGVIIATVTELSFDAIGLTCALAATMGFAIQNLFSKKCLKETGVHHLRLLYILAVISTVFFMPIWFLYDGLTIMNDTGLLHSTHLPRLIGLLVIDGFCSFFQNLIAFTVISLVSPLSYAVANATKRISIVTVSLLTLKNPVTPMNLVGMFTAIIGVFLYNKAKYDHSRERILPTIVEPSVKKEVTINEDIPTDISFKNKKYLDPRNGITPFNNGSLRTVDSSGNIFGTNVDNQGRPLSVTRWV